MKIYYEEQFRKSLEEIVSFISKDKKEAAKRFKVELKKKIEDMSQNPRIYRASRYFESDIYRFNF